jgi:hypothetical protein
MQLDRLAAGTIITLLLRMLHRLQVQRRIKHKLRGGLAVLINNKY